MKLLSLLALASVLTANVAFAQAPAAPAATPATKAAKPAPAPPPSAADIASAKAKGMVWANLNTKVYHFSTDSTYGTTKNGKFMTEADAKAAGYRAAKTGGGSKKAATPPATK
jgi:hypothetical protein